MLSESCYEESVNPQLEALNAFHEIYLIRGITQSSKKLASFD